MIGKETAKSVINGLLQKYQKVVEEGRFDKYTEEETKKDFILPLFEALGWNIRDSSEVSAEETIAGKRVDYGFRINGIPKFFLETKALKADLNKPEYAQQAINYAHHKSCTWAVLTDFDEGVKIYNAEWKAANPQQAQFLDIPREKFLDSFDDLWLLSKESFEKGLIDQFAEKYGKKIKKTPVGEQLFNDLTVWRERLSKSVYERNKDKNLSETELDEAVQRIIDRLIFIRNCEDRGLEPPTLMPKVREWESRGRGALNDMLKDVYRDFDRSYNGKLFEEHLCDQLEVTNQVLEEVIKGLYHTKDNTINYDFSALDADVLGNVYEQYLGHILKKTAKKATVTEKHAKRKEQGIYYTPTYIVDYIVRNTVGKLLEDPNVDVEKIRVLDPACGSGSFLIKTFDVINEYYSKTGKDSGQTKFDLKTGLPYTRKVKILHDNIFGVDLDSQAVEIAQLNLMLKIAEKKQILPQLERNIKCGNSLIDDEKVAGDKALKWEVKYPKIMENGGFDVVIGNPPYGATFSDCEKKFIKEQFKSAVGRYDSYYYFIERSIKLLREGGFLGFILPDTWLTNHQTKNLRGLILSECLIIKIIGLPQDVFHEANVDTCIIILKKEKSVTKRLNNDVRISVLSKKATQTELINHEFETEFEIKQGKWEEDTRKSFNIHTARSGLTDKIEKDSIKLGKITEMCRGINPYDKYAGQTMETIKNRIYHSSKKLGSEYKKELVGGDIGRYKTDVKSNLWVRYGPWLAAPRDPKFFTRSHIVIQRIRNPALKLRLIATFIDPKDEYYNNSGLTNVILTNSNYSLAYVLALLNSKLMNWYYRQFFRDVNIKPEDLRELPIRIIPESHQHPIIKLVDKMLSLNKRLNELGDKKTDERKKMEEDIKKMDIEIDELVYQLYEITEEEKKIIEESLK